MTSKPIDLGAINADTKYDVIIVGAGFSGISTLHRLRKHGLKAHIFEAASDFGGVWYWNRYPGARVDSEMPFYQMNIPEVYNTWNFSQRFPDHHEIRAYMAHVDKTLNLRKDVTFNATVNGCTWDKNAAQWTVKTANGVEARAKFLVFASGGLHTTNMPQWPDSEKYKGVLLHSAAWPEDISVKGKRVAVIGAGATAVQVVQELAKVTSNLTVLVRSPPYCMPMYQRNWTKEETNSWKGYYPALFAAGRQSTSGFPLTRFPARVQDVSPEEREKYLQRIWTAGGFQFTMSNYNNVVLDKQANKIIYDFWKKKVRERLTDPKKQAVMAPDESPYYFGTKRVPLEQDFYDVLNQDNVEIVDINKHPIKGFTERGLQLGAEDQDRQYDYIVCATGFEAFTGSLANMGLKSKDGVDIKDVWSNGVRTYLGIMISGFPNAFMVYSPQSPAILSNGPTLIECQSDFVCDIIKSLQAEGAKTIEATREAEDEWKTGMDAVVKHTLLPCTNSWWNTSNVPGRKAENQTYIRGIASYEKDCRGTMTGWKGFDVVSASASANL